MESAARIPLIDDLLKEPLPAGSTLLVEFDPASLWYEASLTIAARWLRAGGGRLGYSVAAQPAEKIRSQLKKLGLDTEELERNNRLSIIDAYTPSLGQKSKEKRAYVSLRVADLSIEFAREDREGKGLPTGALRIWDNGSAMARFNDEKAWVEFLLTRSFPRSFQYKSTLVYGIMKEVHSDWVYKNLEGAADGIAEFSVQEVGMGVKNFMRIKRIRSTSFDSDWRQLKTGENSEVILEK